MKLQDLINALQKAQDKVGNVNVNVQSRYDNELEISDVVLEGSHSLIVNDVKDAKVLINIVN